MDTHDEQWKVLTRTIENARMELNSARLKWTYSTAKAMKAGVFSAPAATGSWHVHAASFGRVPLGVGAHLARVIDWRRDPRSPVDERLGFARWLRANPM